MATPLTRGWLFFTRQTILTASSSSATSSGRGGRTGPKSRRATRSWDHSRAWGQEQEVRPAAGWRCEGGTGPRGRQGQGSHLEVGGAQEAIQFFCFH